MDSVATLRRPSMARHLSSPASFRFELPAAFISTKD
jgi:hypothetical protein